MEMKRRLTIDSPRDIGSESPMTATSATPMMTDSFSGSMGRSKVGEVVGGTAAVMCCFPCAVIKLVVLAVYKVPIGLCKRAWNRRKRKRLLAKRKREKEREEEIEGREDDNHFGMGFMLESDDGGERRRLEEEMLGEFYRGFWRSPSQKDD